MNSTIKEKFIKTNTKLSRINTFNALWLHLGNKINWYYSDFLVHNQVTQIKIGN